MERGHDGYTISDDPARLDRAGLLALAEKYGVTFEDDDGTVHRVTFDVVKGPKGLQASNVRKA